MLDPGTIGKLHTGKVATCLKWVKIELKKNCVHKTFQKNAVLKMSGYEDEEAAPWETKKLWGN